MRNIKIDSRELLRAVVALVKRYWQVVMSI
jgi:hypothetical protein